MRQTRASTARPKIWGGLLALALLGAAGSSTGCGRPKIEVIESVGQTLGEDDHQQRVNFEVGDRFTVLLPGLPRGLGPLASLPKRPRTDAKIVKLLSMGRASSGHEVELEGPGMAYVFETVGDGRGRITVFDAANRDRFVLRVNVGADAAKTLKSVGPGRSPARAPNMAPIKVPAPNTDPKGD